jgi:peroxiredoxin
MPQIHPNGISFFRLFSFFFLPIVSCVFNGYCQVVSGVAKPLVGKTIQLCTYSDFITYTEKKLAETKVEADGSFVLKGNLSQAQYCFLKSGNYYADFLAEPQRNYLATWPEFINAKEEAKPYFEKRFKPLVLSEKDTLELNNSIRRFNAFYDKFLEQNASTLLVKSRSGAVVKQLRKVAYTQIGNIADARFRSYVDYNIAIVDLMASGSKSFLYKGYLKAKAVKPFDLMYMEFFNQFFDKYLYELVRSNRETKLLQIVQKGSSWIELDKDLAQKPFLENDTIRQLALVRNFRALFNDEGLNKESILNLMDLVAKESRIDFIRVATLNLKAQLLFLAPGTNAPAFALTTSDGKTIATADLKGKFTYLEITDPACLACVSETKAIAAYLKKYNDKIRFVTVLLNSTQSKAAAFKQQQKLDWEVAFVPSGSSLAAELGIVAVPSYFILNREAKFFRSPALKPSQQIEKDFAEIKYKW